MTNVGEATSTKDEQSGKMINICTKYGFDIFIISGTYCGHRRQTKDNAMGTGKSSPQAS